MGSVCTRVGAGGPSDTDRSVGSSSADGVAACAAATGGGRVLGVTGIRMMGAISQQQYRSVGRYCGYGQRHVRISGVSNGYNQDR